MREISTETDGKDSEQALEVELGTILIKLI